MSFDVNVLSSKPVIKAAANMQNDGGSGGNLGYMMQRKHKEKKDHQYESVFANRPEYDVIDFQKNIYLMDEEKFSFTKFVEQVIKSVLKIFGKDIKKFQK